jgi:tripartite-type tricarboxylate transporter receptor subunit TctC
MDAQSIELIVPYPIHGGSDLRARLLARHLSKALGQDVQVSNVTGAPQGHEAVARAQADGTVLGLISAEIGMMHWKGASQLTWKDYTPLALSFVESAGVIVRGDSPYQDLNGLLQALRSGTSPRLRAAGSPAYGIFRFAWVGLLKEAGIDPECAEWIPTISAEVGIEKMLAGEVDIAPVSFPEARPEIEKKLVRPLAIMADKRHPMFPDVPTVREATGLEWTRTLWRGVVAPAGLPEDVRGRLQQALTEVLRSSEFLNAAHKHGFGTGHVVGPAFENQLQSEDESFGRLMPLIPDRL